jgi:site-specific DNA-methyltransferase (adenine-specific)
MDKVLFSSNKEDWETPIDFFNKLDQEFHFSIDVASNSKNHKCERYYTEKENGLLQDWTNEVVWCNPPYGRKIGDWVEKASKSKAIVVMLIPARTDTKWFHEYIYNKAEIRFIKGRLKFGNSLNSAPFPSMIVIFKGGLTNDRRRKESDRQAK